MSQQANPAVIGGFVLGAIALVVWTMPESETPFSQAAAQGASTAK